MTDTSDTFFDFSVRKNLKRSWQLFRENLWYFLGIAAVMAVLNVFFNTHDGTILKIVASIATLVWSYISLSSVLAAVDGRTELLRFESMKHHLPTVRQTLQFIGVIFGCAIIIGVGLILLVIPGIYFTIRLMFTNFALVDRKGTVTGSMRFSWHMVKKDVFWTALLGFAVATFLIIFGIAIAGVGVLVTYPISLLFLALMYRALLAYQHTAVVEQPAEIQAPEAQ